MNLYQRTGLGRPIDLRFASNRAAVVGSLLALLAAVVSGGLSGDLDLMRAIIAAGAVFLAWAIARELDPDHPGAATLAMILAGPVVVTDGISLGIVAVVLIAARLLAGTVGSPLRTVDVVVLVLLAGFAGSRPEAWPAALALVAAIAVAEPRRPFWVPAAAVAVGTAAFGAPSPAFTIPAPTAPWLASAALLAAAAALRVGVVETHCDVGDRPISPARVVAARVAAAGAVLGVFFGGGATGFALPVVAALAATAVRSLLAGIALIRRRAVIGEPAQPA